MILEVEIWRAVLGVELQGKEVVHGLIPGVVGFALFIEVPSSPTE